MTAETKGILVLEKKLKTASPNATHSQSDKQTGRNDVAKQSG